MPLKLKIKNVSGQSVPIQVRTNSTGDFFTSEKQVRLSAGSTYEVNKSDVNTGQIENLRKNKLIAVSEYNYVEPTTTN